MSATGDKRTVSGGPRPPDTVLIWDLPVRVFHWALMASIVTAHLTTDGLGKIHRFAGYIAVSLLIFRIVWGFSGTKFARFSDFVRGPRTVLKYTADELTGFADRKLGHNPAGGAMIVALLLVVAGIGTTGIMMRNGFFGSETVETVHWMLAYSLFVLVPLHVIGVILASASHKENLALSMVTGRKPRRGTPGEEEAASREMDTKLRGTGALALVALLAVIGTLGWPQVTAQMEALEKRRAAIEAAEARQSESNTSVSVADTSANATASEPKKTANGDKPVETATVAKSPDVTPETGGTTATPDTSVAGKSADEDQGETLGREIAEAERPATASAEPDVPARSRTALLAETVARSAGNEKGPALVAEAVGRATSREIADASEAEGSAEAFEPVADAEPSQQPGSSTEDEQMGVAEDDGTAVAGLVDAPARKSKPVDAASARSKRSAAQTTVREKASAKSSTIRTASATSARKVKQGNPRRSRIATAQARVGKPAAGPRRAASAKNRQALAGPRTTRVRASAVRTRVARTGRPAASRKRARYAFSAQSNAKSAKRGNSGKGRGRGRGGNSGRGRGGGGNSGKGGGGNSGSGGGHGGHGGGDD